ncbi:MAG: biotin transporter BioY [Sutterellaceae bacterium]|nr:biotin transporter BioY [Sutterellaceae bacterium]MDD7441574.1 biotin transporter BioY [Sutterellaceae bacterium]MDY2868464.1 biotin transporter BioY [Mesosutterella sp.]
MALSASSTSTAKWLESQTLLFKAAAVLFGSLLLTAGSYITVPMVPVPMTMQTFAVMVVGALFGWKMGAAAVAFWLLQGAAGLPVFAPGAAGGVARFFGPTGGYLFSFFFAAMMTGWLMERTGAAKSFVRSMAIQLAGNLFVLAVGGAWLCAMIGLEKGIALGVTPFVLGAFTKSVLGAAVVRGVNSGISQKRLH